MKRNNQRQRNFFSVCRNCKTKWSCCHETTPPITEKRRGKIESYLKEKKISIENAFVTEEYVYPKLDSEGYCVFQDRKTRKCLIHSVKPETCVAGPITFDMNTRTNKIEWFVKMEKICALAGHVYQDKALLGGHVQISKNEISRLVNELDRNELKAILKKDEPETVKIGEDDIDRRILQKIK
jgi:Fe-S-cluster containining protein